MSWQGEVGPAASAWGCLKPPLAAEPMDPLGGVASCSAGSLQTSPILALVKASFAPQPSRWDFLGLPAAEDHASLDAVTRALKETSSPRLPTAPVPQANPPSNKCLQAWAHGKQMQNTAGPGGSRSKARAGRLLPWWQPAENTPGLTKRCWCLPQPRCRQPGQLPVCGQASGISLFHQWDLPLHPHHLPLHPAVSFPMGSLWDPSHGHQSCFPGPSPFTVSFPNFLSSPNSHFSACSFSSGTAHKQDTSSSGGAHDQRALGLILAVQSVPVIITPK